MTPRPGRHVAHRLALALALAWWCLATSARADSQLRVVLEYSADPALACPGAAELSASVTRQLGYDAFTGDASEQRLRIVISKLPDGAEAQLEWIDRQQHSEGERRLTSKGSCEELVSNLAFAAAVQIQLHAAASPPPAEPPAPPVVAPPPAPVAATPPPPLARTERPASRPRVSLGVGALMRHGLTPGVQPGLRVFGALAKQSWSFELSAHATLPSELEQADGTGFTARELGSSLAPCWRLPPLGVCGVGTLSLLHARGKGVDQVRSAASLTAGIGGRLQLAWPELERFGVVVQAEALAVLLPREVLLNQQTVWDTEPVAFTAILDFAAIFR